LRKKERVIERMRGKEGKREREKEKEKQRMKGLE